MDFHSIQTEKAKAMARYRRLRNIAKIWRLFEIVIALSLVSWSSNHLQTAAKFAGRITANFSAYAFNPLINFAIFNTIIIFLILFSRQKADTEGGRDEDSNLDLVVFTETDFEINSPVVPLCEVEEELPANEEREREEGAVVVVENAVVKEEIEAVRVAIEAAKRQIRRFQRSQSAYLRHGKPRHQLRRSETDINAKERAISVIDRAVDVNSAVDERAISVIDRVVDVNSAVNERAISVIDRVDSLSSEEFRKTIDEFIARQQRLRWAQKLAEKQLVDI